MTNIDAIPTKRCGNCLYGRRMDLQMVMCFGCPPTPSVIGGRPDALGRVALQIENIRPQLGINEQACALWDAAPPMIDLSFIKAAGKVV